MIPHVLRAVSEPHRALQLMVLTRLIIVAKKREAAMANTPGGSEVSLPSATVEPLLGPGAMGQRGACVPQKLLQGCALDGRV